MLKGTWLKSAIATATLAALMSASGEQPLNAQRQEPRLTDAQLLDKVQSQTLKYFTDFSHPISGMARERTNGVEVYGKDIVTTGGTGFGIMAMIAGTEHGWLTRQQMLDRVTKIVNFLDTHAHTYHGAFPHYMDGMTGETFEWGRNDDGGDLVETSFLMMGLLSARQYFSGDNPEEAALREKINRMWENVDWQFYTRGENRLYWNWSPNHQWDIGLPIRGYNEAMVAYVLAASSPTHPIGRAVYQNGWAGNGAIRNGTPFGDSRLLGPEPMGGPLFLSQYSFLGLDPNGLRDEFANYADQTRNHTLANRAYVIENPKRFDGYGEKSWGLTASEGPHGYDVYSPTNDQGVIAPTAAISSLPYTPEYAMQALRHFYEDYDGRLWGRYGFVDAFNESAGWQSSENLAIDQGPEVVMIENYRTGLLWNLFMSAPEVKQGLEKLGFQSPHLAQNFTPQQQPRPSF
ncbi:MAG TPA: glucoamylase family protein [Patescibacteria group bacterium]|nr:glucoamylase family protein [Patescibacteria group bacterium]